MNTIIMSSQFVAVLVAAVITSIVALLVAYITKETKVAEFRNATLNSVRDEIAEMLGALSIMQTILTRIVMSKTLEEKEKYISDNVDLMVRVESLLYKLKIRSEINQYKKLSSLLTKLEKWTKEEFFVATKDQKSSFLEEFRIASAVVLRDEWLQVQAVGGFLKTIFRTIASLLILTIIGVIIVA